MSGIYILYWEDVTYFYLGQAKNFKERLRVHLIKLKQESHPNKKIQNIYNKYGAPGLHIVEECTLEKLTEREQFHLDKIFGHKDCCNISPTAESVRGTKWSEESKKKRRGAGNPMFGFNHTQESVNKVILALTGKNNYLYRPIRNIKTGEVFDTLDLAAASIGKTKGILWAILNKYKENKTDLRYV